MVEYTKCYLAHLDVLGFKSKIQHQLCQEILSIYQSFCNPVENICLRINGNPEHEIKMGSDVKMKVMSDSICFYIRADMPNALFRLLLCCGSFRTKLLEFSPPVLIRGAIAVGDLYADNDIIFGPVLVEAYLMQEEIAKYPRIIITGETLNLGILNMNSTESQNQLYSMVFRDKDDLYTVNQIELSNGWELNGIHYAALMKHILEVLDSTTTQSVRDKYLYLKKQFLVPYNSRGVNNV